MVHGRTCVRTGLDGHLQFQSGGGQGLGSQIGGRALGACLLYTSDAADD